MDRETEFALVQRIAGGNTAAFDVVSEEFRARLYGFLARWSKSRDLAEDLLEETWLRLAKHAGRLQPGTPLGPWLYTVASNLPIRSFRSRLMEDAGVAGLMPMWTGRARGLRLSRRRRPGSWRSGWNARWQRCGRSTDKCCCSRWCKKWIPPRRREFAA
jgi:hypothetical protein